MRPILSRNVYSASDNDLRHGDFVENARHHRAGRWLGLI